MFCVLSHPVTTPRSNVLENRARAIFLPKDLSASKETLQSLEDFGFFITEQREQVLYEDKVIACACLEHKIEALKLPNTAHGNLEVGPFPDQCKYLQHYLTVL